MKWVALWLTEVLNMIHSAAIYENIKWISVLVIYWIYLYKEWLFYEPFVYSINLLLEHCFCLHSFLCCVARGTSHCNPQHTSCHSKRKNFTSPYRYVEKSKSSNISRGHGVVQELFYSWRECDCEEGNAILVDETVLTL